MRVRGGSGKVKIPTGGGEGRCKGGGKRKPEARGGGKGGRKSKERNQKNNFNARAL